MDRKRIENSEGDQRRRTKTERLNQSQETFTDFTKKLDFNSLAKDLKKRVANLLPEVVPRPKDLGPRPGNHGGRPSMLPLPSSAPSSPASSRPRAEMAGYEGLAAALLGGFSARDFDSLLGATLQSRGLLSNNGVNLFATLFGALMGGAVSDGGVKIRVLGFSYHKSSGSIITTS
jgi:hypothetical protein